MDAWFQVLFDPSRLAAYQIAGVQKDGNDSLKKPYVTPLVRLLARYFATADRRTRSVYRDELLRYSLHRAPPQVRVRYFEEILPGLEEAVLAYLPSDREQAGALLREVHAPLLVPPTRVAADASYFRGLHDDGDARISAGKVRRSWNPRWICALSISARAWVPAFPLRM